MKDLRERCIKLSNDLHHTYLRGDSFITLLESFARECERDGYRKGVEDLLAGVLREQQYHEFLEDKGEMRHPILACKEIASYARALLATGEG